MPTNVIEADSTNKDAFGAFRVSEKTTLEDSQNVVDFDTRYFFSAVIYDSASPLILAESPNASGVGSNGSLIGPLNSDSRLIPLELDSTYASGKVVLQYKEYAPYSPAKSQIAYRTGIFSPNPAKPDEQVNLVLRTSCGGTIEDIKVPQSSWNKDTLLGTGGSSNPSGVTLATENIQIFWLDAQMLYSGRVRLGFSFYGVDVCVHEIYIANIQNLPTLQNFNLPLRQEITNVSGRACSRSGIFDKYNGIFLEIEDDFNAGKATTFYKCGAILSEGGKDLSGIVTSEFSTLSTTVGTALTPLLSIRPLSTFNGFPNNSLLVSRFFSAINTGNADCVLVVLHNSAITGGAWVPAGDGGTFHTYEINLTATSLTGGHRVAATALSKSGGASTQSVSRTNLGVRTPVLYSRIDDLEISAETLTLAAITDSSTTVSMPSIDIEELRQ